MLADKNRLPEGGAQGQADRRPGISSIRCSNVRRGCCRISATRRRYSPRPSTAGKRVLFEGAHGTMLDIDHGTYPFVTSSNCIASAVFSGGGARARASSMRCSASARPTPRGSARARSRPKSRARSVTLCATEGDEFGSATGRPRRIGWFDAVLARHAMRLNGMWGLALTKLDVLTGIDPLRVCVAYQVGANATPRCRPDAGRSNGRGRSMRNCPDGARA